MPCPTCDHAMSAIDMLKDEGGNAFGLFHCPRCGTLKKVFSFHEDVVVPRAVIAARKAVTTTVVELSERAVEQIREHLMYSSKHLGFKNQMKSIISAEYTGAMTDLAECCFPAEKRPIQ